MVSVENKLSVRPLFAAAVILSIFVSGFLFTGASLVNAQADDSITTDYRLENIEKLLAEIKDELDNIHSTYVTGIKLEDELKIQSLEMLLEIAAVSSDVAAVSSDLALLSTDVNNIEEQMTKDTIWIQGIGIGVAVLVIVAVLKEGLKIYTSRKVSRVKAA